MLHTDPGMILRSVAVNSGCASLTPQTPSVSLLLDQPLLLGTDGSNGSVSPSASRPVSEPNMCFQSLQLWGPVLVLVGSLQERIHPRQLLSGNGIASPWGKAPTPPNETFPSSCLEDLRPRADHGPPLPSVPDSLCCGQLCGSPLPCPPPAVDLL